MGMMLRRSKQVPKQVPADPHAPTIVSPLEHVQRAHEAERQAHEKTKGELDAATKLIEQTTAPTKQEQPAAHAAAIPAAMADKKGKKQ